MDYGNGDGDQGFDDQRRVLSGVSSEMMKRPRFFRMLEVGRKLVVTMQDSRSQI